MWLINRFDGFRIFRVGLLILLTFVSFGASTSNRSALLNKESGFLPVLKVSVDGTPILSNSTQNFGSVNLLSTSAAIAVDLENIGLPEDLTIGSVSLSGANPSDFILNTTGLVNTLATGATTSFTITFAPTASGTRTATLDIVSDDISSPFKINLEGVGVKLNQTITFSPLPAKTYGDASFALSATATSGLAVSYLSDNLSVATISGNTVTIVGAGSAVITASQAGNGTYNAAASVLQTLVVNKASLTATADNKSKVYGTVNPPLTVSYSGFVAGDNSSVIDVVPSLSTTAVTGSTVGPYPITVSGGLDNNYSFTYIAGTLSVTKATPVISWAPPAPITYGAPLTGSQLNASTPVAGTFTYSPALGSILNSGVNQILTVDFIPTDATNYNSVIGTTTQLTVNKAVVTATAENKSREYNVVNPTLTIIYSGFVNGDNSGVLDVTPVASTTATVSSSVGSYSITVSGGLDDNYTFNYVSGTLTITKATPVVSWSNPASITYGTALSATQLNATASVAGSFAYTPASGTILNAGAGQVLSVNFTPTDITNYNSVNGTTVTITVLKANPIITWANPASITYGTALSATQLNATASVAGSFAYTPASGTILNAGAGQVLSVNFTPTDITNYNSVNGTTVTITVLKANPIITWANPASITYGTALSATQLNATASVAGS
ncbi:MAG: choice-of-anchor D domain-containing protein, partial [Cyclobacteriaceae bacterium]|nr:choice-of-anchor D domain-containing protein [Cyclobacteriaceae bacterium]